MTSDSARNKANKRKGAGFEIDVVPMFDGYEPKSKPIRRFVMEDPESLADNAMQPDEVAALTKPQREARVMNLVTESNLILDHAIAKFIDADDKELTGVVGLFSGGNDSTTLCHVMLPRISHLAHANTTIGIEETREFVRATSQSWSKPLLEFTPPRESDHYRALVLAHGFPGPGHHYKMYQRLKERALNEVRRRLVTSRNQRVVYLAGRRRTESARRANVPAAERENSVVWVSPMVNWTKLDLNTYRVMQGNVPVNRVTDLIHMSGECLCGSFARKGELDEIAEWFPEVARQIRELEQELEDRTDIPHERKTWGWSTNYTGEPPLSGPMCSSCDSRFSQMSIEEAFA
jgi:3'-phosphoadenosine 5'-phosphosulfate sulfotransferase (PAPS reductase)/FAD synthetase